MKRIRAFYFYFILLLFFIGAATVAAVLYLGIYNVSALQQHTSIVYELLEFARVKSIAVRSDDDAPDLEQLDWHHSGAALYVTHCQQCHGAPGIAPEAFSMGMSPAPSPIVKIAQVRSPEEMYWTITNGVRMSGMPAWKYHINREQRWEIVALITKMTSFTTKEYADLQKDAAFLAASDIRRPPKPVKQNKQERLEAGRIALAQYNCTGCHEIPGITAAATHVGPPLKGLEEQVFLVGLLPMNEHTLKQWIRFPQAVKPGSAMPNMGVPEEYAKLMVEYLLSDSVNPQ